MYHERDNILYASIMYALVPILSVISLVVGVYFWNKGLKGLKDKMNIVEPYEYFRKYLRTWIGIIFVIILIGALVLAGNTSRENSTKTSQEKFVTSNISWYDSWWITQTYHKNRDNSSQPTETKIIAMVLFGILILLWILNVLYFGRVLASLGRELKIEKFDEAAEIWYILNYGMIVWIPLAFVIIGYFAILTLHVIFSVYLIQGASMIPRKMGYYKT